MKFSIKVKLITTFFILISLPMGILGYVSYAMESNSIQTVVQQQIKEQMSDTSELIGKTIDSIKHSLEISSLNSQLGRAAQNLSRSDIDAAFEYIQNVQKNNKDFMEELIITDAKGRVIIDTDTKEPDIDLSDRDYMKKTLSTGSETVSEVLTSRFTGNPAIFISYPLKEGDKIVGTLVGSIKFSSISNYASKIKVGQSGYAYMIDKNGLLVYHPDDSKILTENVSDTASDDLKSIINDMKAGKSSEGFYTYNNVYKYVVFQPVENWEIAVTANYNEYMAAAINIRNYTIIIVLIAIIISMLFAYLYSTKGIINPIVKLQALMKRAGDGDLTVNIKIKSNDEIGELGKSFNDMIEHQDNIVKNVINASQQLNEASEEMAASSEEISVATQEISNSITQVANDAEKQNDLIVDISEVLVQLSSLVKLAQNGAQNTSFNADKTLEAAEFGRNKVEETVKAMNMINVGSHETGKALDVLNRLSVEAGDIVNTINSITDQTNLLALNAAIEAARAGEYGKGFSVVADEVRKLAEESNDKAKEIDLLLNEMMKQTQNAVTAMEKSKAEVDNGVVIVSETDEAFVNIIKAIENIVANINEILNITGEEVASSDKVVKLINKIATLTENNSVNSENVVSSIKEQVKAIESLTATAEETSAMSEELSTLVETFKI